MSLLIGMSLHYSVCKSSLLTQKEDINKYMADLVTSKKDPIGAMGYDAPIAVLNDKPESLFNYFKQLFAQVTNPPIDAIEKIVTSELSYLGAEGIYFTLMKRLYSVFN